MKLTSMTDFVLKQNKYLKNAPDSYNQYCKIVNYANFLKQPLKLEMFVPCIDGKPFTDFQLEILNSNDGVPELRKAYQQAKEKVLFKGFQVIGVDENHIELELKNNNFWIDFFKHSAIIITDSYYIDFPVKLCEDLLDYNLTLTPNAIKQLGL